MARPPPFADPDVEATFQGYPATLRKNLLRLRKLIFETAAQTEGVGPIVETLKWGQPAYLPERSKTGTTIRIDVFKNQPNRYAMYVHCQTNLVRTYRELYEGALTFEDNRAIIFNHGQSPAADTVKHCIALALTYHLRPKVR